MKARAFFGPRRYALLSASLSLGFAVANYGGALVLNLLGVTPNGAVHED